jgi:hypothetical protein
MFRIFLDDPLFDGYPGPQLTGSPASLTSLSQVSGHFRPISPPVAKVTGPLESHRRESPMKSAESAYWCHVCMRTIPASEVPTHQHDAGADGPR